MVYNRQIPVWYCYTPTKAELSELSELVDDYLECFTEPTFGETEETEDVDMSM